MVRKGKMVIYQVLPRLFGNRNGNLVKGGTIEQNGCGKFSAFTADRLKRIRSLGATHVWYTGVLEHATQTDYTAYDIRRDSPAVVKGLAGSPYAIKDYYDVDPDLADKPAARMKEFQSLVARTHRAGLKVLIDFVPNHVARQYHSDAAPEGVGDFGDADDKGKAFSPENNFYYILGAGFVSPQGGGDYSEFPAKATGNDCFSATPGRFDWYDTVKLNYGVDYLGGGSKHFDPIPNTWQRMLDILKYWCGKGVDGFRCDMSEMVPVEFWHWAIGSVKADFPQAVFVAEIYNPAVYDSYINYGGFDYLYDKVGLYDKLRSVATGRCPASEITYSWQSLGGLQRHMLNFIENHDEQRVASDFFAGDAKKGRAPMIVAALMNTNPVMVYSGQEYGERGMDDEGYSGVDGRTTIYDYWATEKIRKALFDTANLEPAAKDLHDFYARLLGSVCKEKAVAVGKFFDLTYCNSSDYARYPAHKLYSFLRGCAGELLLVVANFSNDAISAYVNIPGHAFNYMEIAPGTYEAMDILASEGESFAETLAPDCPVRVNVPAQGGVVMKFAKKA